MVYFVSTLRVQLIIWPLLIASAHTYEYRGKLPDLGFVTTFLKQFIRPYIVQSNKAIPRSHDETKIEKAIRLKVAELKPLLQDDEVEKSKVETDNNLTLEGNDETTIIEFVPKSNLPSRRFKDKSELKEIKPKNQTETDSFQKNINKYKKLRQTIKDALNKEKTEDSTKKLITQTLDEMIAKLIGSQCTWKGPNVVDLRNYIFKNKNVGNGRKSITKLDKLSNKEWMDLREQYLKFLKFNDNQSDEFMKQFHGFFSGVINDTWNLSNRYKVRCQLVKVSGNEKIGESKPFLRSDDKMVDKDKCNSFKVCSDELKDFLNNFYSFVNNTAVSTFRNYAVMYVKDGNADIDGDKDIVVSVLKNISNATEKKVIKIFKKELAKFILDKNKKKEENIQYISKFITSTAEQVQKVLKKNLDDELGAMKTNLFATVKDDLNVNLRLDMDNLARLFLDRICALFVICNGKYAAQRHATFKSNDNTFVKVQLSLDVNTKDSKARHKSFAEPWRQKDMTHRKNMGMVDIKNYSNVTVTRTTIKTMIETTMESVNQTTKTTIKTSPSVKDITNEAMTDIVNNDI